MGNIHVENKGRTIICLTNKEYWWMFMNKKEKVELWKKEGVKFPRKVSQKILFCPLKIVWSPCCLFFITLSLGGTQIVVLWWCDGHTRKSTPVVLICRTKVVFLIWFDATRKDSKIPLIHHLVVWKSWLSSTLKGIIPRPKVLLFTRKKSVID